MSMQTFLVGPVQEGLRTDVKPWSTPEDSFVTLTNAYQWRGRIVKRSGYTKLGRLTNGTPVMGLKIQEGFGVDIQNLIAFDTTQSYIWNGNAFVNLPSVMPVTWSGTNSQFFNTTNYAGAFWATNSKPGLHAWGVKKFSGSVGMGNAAQVTVDSAGNNVQLNDYVYFLNLQDTVSGNAAVLAKVTLINVPNTTFTVTAVNLPSTSNFMWVNGTTNKGIVLDSMQTIAGQDGIRYYGVLNNGTGWANYSPPVDLNNALLGALLIFPYRGYLVFLNTTEGNEEGTSNYGNRARWTQIGTPYYSFPVPQTPNIAGVDVQTARDDLFGRGGAYDAPTSEVIVGAGFIRDILVVYFERSTWRLRFVNNAQNPFVWERVNIELGSSCTGSTIPFDKGLMAISNRGIVISDGNDTSRFDEKIPDDIFNIRQANQGLQRVQGIRTFRTKLNYWTFPSSDNPTGTFPDQVLVFNYETKNWSFFDDCFTCFGYFYESGTGYTWGDLPNAWSSYTDITWNSGVSQAGYESIVAGNQQGYVLLLEQTNGQNDPSLSISAIANGPPSVFTSTNNNLPDGTWITLSGVTGATSSDGVTLNGRNYKVNNPTLDANNFTLSEFKPISAGMITGLSFVYTVSYQNILPGSAFITVGNLTFTDPASNGNLVGAGGSGTIDYSTGLIGIVFNPPIGPSAVNIRVVSLDPTQGLSPVTTTGVYALGGEIAKISGIEITTKLFNFFKDNQRTRLSRIDFYTDRTSSGQFICNIFGDSDNIPINTPLTDNLQSNVVLTSANPYQIGQGEETIYRLYCDALAQTIQVQLTFNDAQMAVSNITNNDIQLLAMMFYARSGGRLI